MSRDNPLAGKEYTSIWLGDIALDDRTVPIRVERGDVDGHQVWRFAAQTCEKIPALFEQHAERRRRVRPWVFRLARLMDSRFRVPGTHVRFGLDPLIGLIPGAGRYADRLHRACHAGRSEAAWGSPWHL
ncbi:MAG: DUF4112 domain-containing protein [Planctomycetota bacterium]